MNRSVDFTDQLGLTYIEIILVVTICAVIVGLGLSGLSELQSVFKLRSAGDEIRSMMQMGRELAVANKNQDTYSISLASGIVILRSSTAEVSRYQTPKGIAFSPGSFDWDFVGTSGKLTGCVLPCELTLSSGDSIEMVVFHENGIVN